MLTRLLVAFAAAASALSGCDKNNDNKTVAKNVTALAPAQPQSKILITAKGTIRQLHAASFRVPRNVHELYPILVTGSGGSQSHLDSLPDMFEANINNGYGTEHGTHPSNLYLRRILDLHDASLAKEVLWSRQSVRNTVRKLFEAKKGAISTQLRNAVTMISFSFDMWTSPNRYVLFGLHAHYLDASYKVQSRLRALRQALRRVWGSHSGDSQATTIYGVLGEYGIRDRIGAGVCDNASSNIDNNKNKKNNDHMTTAVASDYRL
ncbi:hypothetical protein X797_012438 [Metarhizium robertsii]|uniref:Uncharacterized protein n=1 Tax=Metarhizium robertsii TaxID=568076 RepID=A0A014QPC7_9HYPO|nr:hypothetical protein X797_012438 [Metarhizium robertsii]